MLAAAIDYAGLFPPAELAMDAALDNYLSYRTGGDAWALGRLVVPVARIGELEASLARLPAPWPRISLSALIGAEIAGDLDAIEHFNRKHVPSGARVDTVELKAPTPDAAREILAAIPRRFSRYLEVSLGETMAETLEVIVADGGCAKVRTGGTSPEAFPEPDRLAAFLEAAANRKVPFKATAGLHHPVRGNFRLTYADDAPSSVMHGYLNLLIASSIAWVGGHSPHVREVLLEQDPTAFWINGDAIVWREQRIPTRTLAEARRCFVHSFGSCSFTEPVEELNVRYTR